MLADPPRWLPNQFSITDIPQFSDLLQQATTLGSQVFGNFFSFFSGSITIVLQLLLLLVLSIMLLSDPLSYRKLLLRLFPSGYRRRADEIMTKCEVALLCWLGGVSISSLFVAIFCFVGLVILQVPYPFANAIKFSLRRPVGSGGPNDFDVYGAQQHAPLLDLLALE